MSEHARLSPSSAERWLTCPGSIRLSEALAGHGTHEDSPWAEEGTAAHELGELAARLAFAMIPLEVYRARLDAWHEKYDVSDEQFEEMGPHVEAYVELLEERMALYPYSQLMLEQRLQTGIPESWGTSDAVIVSPQHVEVIDLKYGKGVEVQAKGNPQLRLYALGALDTYGDILGDTEVVRITVFQPRLNHTLTDEMTPEALRSWRAFIRPTAELALLPDAPLNPSDKACRWCPASGRCEAQLRWVFDVDYDTAPELLSPEQMAEYLPRLPLVSQWMKDFEAAALTTAYSEGRQIPGYKVVLSGGNRSVSDPNAVVRELIARRGYPIDDVAPRKLKGIGDLEKLVGGKKAFAEILGEYYPRGEGRPSLVHEDDPRPAIDPETEAAKEFSGTPLSG